MQPPSFPVTDYLRKKNVQVGTWDLWNFPNLIRPAIGTLTAKDVETGRPVGELSMASHHVTVEIVDGFIPPASL